MMKSKQLILVLVLSASLMDVSFGQKRPYTTRFDNVDIEMVIKNERLLKNYIGCMLDRNSCTSDASEMKSRFFFNFDTDGNVVLYVYGHQLVLLPRAFDMYGFTILLERERKKFFVRIAFIIAACCRVC